MNGPLAERFALHAVADGGAVDGAQPAGSQAAGAGLVRAIAQAADVREVGCFGAAARAQDCERMLRGHGFGGEVVHIAQGRPQDIAPFGTLYQPAPALDRLAWRRLGVGERRYSLCGVTHTLASHAAMTAVAGMLAAPLRSWDALVCTSRVVRDSVREVLERQADYLRARLGAQRFELPQLPLIPPGVHCADFDTDAARRADVRRRLGIGEDDVAFLFPARPALHAEAHPQQLFAALERAATARAAGARRRVHLLLCGELAHDAGDAAWREAAAALCPSVRLTVLEGRVPELQRDARAAADVFVAPADTVQDTSGPGLVEAMAAGLPCVVSDWNGCRDTVRDGIDGYRIPTVMPAAGAGLDLAQRYDDGVDSYDLYCGHISRAVALDGTLLAQACERLVHDAPLRRELGANARRHARQTFDWSIVFARYRMLWSELDERRRADAVLAPLPPLAPDRLDPFALFATYPSMQFTPMSLVELAPDASLALVRQYRELAANRATVASLPTLEEFGQIFGSIGSRPMQVDELLDTLGPCDRPALLRGLAWLARMDLLRIRADEMGNAGSL